MITIVSSPNQFTSFDVKHLAEVVATSNPEDTIQFIEELAFQIRRTKDTELAHAFSESGKKLNRMFRVAK
jgi:hypothetical protein